MSTSSSTDRHHKKKHHHHHLQSCPNDLVNIPKMLLTLQNQIADEFKAVHLIINTISQQVACLESTTQPTEDDEDEQSLVNATGRKQSLTTTTERE